jgi:hypothetical protein
MSIRFNKQFSFFISKKLKKYNIFCIIYFLFMKKHFFFQILKYEINANIFQDGKNKSNVNSYLHLSLLKPNISQYNYFNEIIVGGNMSCIKWTIKYLKTLKFHQLIKFTEQEYDFFSYACDSQIFECMEYFKRYFKYNIDSFIVDAIGKNDTKLVKYFIKILQKRKFIFSNDILFRILSCATINNDIFVFLWKTYANQHINRKCELVAKFIENQKNNIDCELVNMLIEIDKKSIILNLIKFCSVEIINKFSYLIPLYNESRLNLFNASISSNNVKVSEYIFTHFNRQHFHWEFLASAVRCDVSMLDFLHEKFNLSDINLEHYKQWIPITHKQKIYSYFNSIQGK